jgi:hypothetical protein
MGLKRKPPSGNVRRVRSTGQNICGVLTNKAGRTVQFESFAEHSLLMQLDRDPQVTDYASQPETLAFIDEGGKTRHYTPDFLVWYADGRQALHEVTRTERAEHPDIQRRENAAKAICQQRNWQYVVHTEQTLPKGHELSNLLLLFRYRASAYADQTIAQTIQDYFHQERRVDLGTLVTYVGSHEESGRVYGLVYHWLWHGKLEMNWHKPLLQNGMPSGEVWFAGGDSQ